MHVLAVQIGDPDFRQGDGVVGAVQVPSQPSSALASAVTACAAQHTSHRAVILAKARISACTAPARSKTLTFVRVTG